MNKINNKSITLTLGILAIFTFGIMAIPAKTNAQQLGGYITTGNENIRNNNLYYYQNPVYIPTPAPVVYTNPAPVGPMIVYSSTTNPSTVRTAPRTIVRTKTTSPATTVAKTETPKESDLAANAIFGSNTFMPSGIVQWIFFAILILLIVLLARKIFGAEKNYHATPMKHD